MWYTIPNMKVFIEQTTTPNQKNIFDKNIGIYKTVSFHLSYPYPYGYILNTLAPDGDELDCYIITDQQLTAATIIECDAIGMVEWWEDGKEDHKILAIMNGEQYTITDKVKDKLTEFAKHFFEPNSKKNYKSGEYQGKIEAQSLIKKCSQS